MLDLQGAVLAASTTKSVGVVIAVLVTLGFVWYVIANIRSGRDEVGAEIELAPNRKPYFDDEALEGPRLTRVLSTGLVLLAVCAVGLPLYWLNEPGRQTGAVEMFDTTFVNRGAALFATTGEGGYNCAGCHGAEGVGGVAPFTLTDADNEFVATVNWQAPALNTVLLRYSEDEVRDILVYGRPGTPMPAWGEAGGGPLTSQQIDELIAYMESIQISSDEAKAQVEEQLRKELDLSEGAPIDYTDPVVGETLFNLGLSDGFAGGAYSCARCHTKGASIVDGSAEPADADLSDHVGFEPGSGAFGFNLTDGVVPRQFLSLDDLIDFLRKGSEFGMLYGQRGQGSGRMPGYGDNPNTEDEAQDDGMFTDGMLRAVALYEASLGEGDVTDEEESGTGTTSTTAPTSGGAGANPTTTTTEEP
ncbi:MAG: c-type cytochrome [Acidimicrobiia bacterium]|jgi:mono/diheme cytochrome c family protein